MAQETFYFSHDYNPLGDSKLRALIGIHGAVGYGVYWRVVEKLHTSETNLLPLKKYEYIAIGQELSTSPDIVESIINDSINTFELFKTDGQSFWSERVFRNIEKRMEVVERNRKAGKISAEVRSRLKTLSEKYPNISPEDLTPVEHPLTDVEQVLNVRQQRKEKEIKLKEIK